MFDNNSIFQQVDNEEQKQSMNFPAKPRENQEQRIKDDLSRLLEEESDYKTKTNEIDKVANKSNFLSHQFDSVDKSDSIIDQAFAKVDNQDYKPSNQLVFPDDESNSGQKSNENKAQ